jgi:hypothetical protein
VDNDFTSEYVDNTMSVYEISALVVYLRNNWIVSSEYGKNTQEKLGMSYCSCRFISKLCEVVMV